jgi:malonyl-CoA O-methyltransferase
VGYIESPVHLLAELCRVTKHGGIILVSDFHPGAYQAGWRRSFRSGSGVFEIESYCHTTDQLVAAGRGTGIKLRQVLEPHLGEPERHIMQSAGKRELLDHVSAIPAVLIVEWERC